MSTIRFYHDLSSPFSYIASTQIESLCEDLDARLIWHPMLLGGLFKHLGGPLVPMAAMSRPKRANALQDLARYAEVLRVPLRWPSRFPVRSVYALRAVLVAEAHSPGDAARLTHRLYSAAWVENIDIGDVHVLQDLATEIGLYGEELLDRARDPQIKRRLFERTEAAAAAGVFGAPTLQIDGGDPIWGQDRLELVRWLAQKGEPSGSR